MTRETDVLIVGSGLTALIAADRVLMESDASVTLVSAGQGASPYIHGFSYPVGAGDNEALLIQDTLRSGGYENDPELVRALVSEVSGLPAFFAGLGLSPDEEDGAVRLFTSLGSSRPRIATIGNDTGPVLMKALRKRLLSFARFLEVKNCRLVNLIAEGGRIAGGWFLESGGHLFPVFSSRTLLATGGYSALFPVTTNSPDCGGDTLAIADRAGVTLRDLSKVQFEPCVSIRPDQTRGKGLITTMFHEGAVLRNRDGIRFLENSRYPERECMQKDELSAAIFEEIRNGRPTENGGVLFDAAAVPSELFEERYAPYLNRYLAAGIDLRTTPAEVAPAAHTSCGGIRITPDCRTALPGLFAAGECAGGLHGKNRLGGNGGLMVLSFGRIAGKTLASEMNQGSASEDREKTVSDERSQGAFDALLDAFPELLVPPLPDGLPAAWDAQRKAALGRGAGIGASEEDRRSALREIRDLKDALSRIPRGKRCETPSELLVSERLMRYVQDLRASELILNYKETKED